MLSFSKHGWIFFRSAVVIALTFSPVGFPIASALAQTDQPVLRPAQPVQPAAQPSDQAAAQPAQSAQPAVQPAASVPDNQSKSKTDPPWQLFPAILRPSIQKTSEPDLSVVVPSDVELKAVTAVSNLKHYSLVVCTVENRTSIPIIIDADHAVLGAGASGQSMCASQKDIDAIGRPPTTMAQKFKSNLKATIVAAGTIGGEEMFEGFKTERKPVRERYEWDEQRREHEEDRFGERLLYPGDTTQGSVYFPLQADEHPGMIISMPVKSFYNGANKAILSGKIGGSRPSGLPGKTPDSEKKQDGHG